MEKQIVAEAAGSTAAKAAGSTAAKAAKKNSDHVALVDKYLAQYPAAKSIRASLIADNKMVSSDIAVAVRKFMDKRIGA